MDILNHDPLKGQRHEADQRPLSMDGVASPSPLVYDDLGKAGVRLGIKVWGEGYLVMRAGMLSTRTGTYDLTLAIYDEALVHHRY